MRVLSGICLFFLLTAGAVAQRHGGFGRPGGVGMGRPGGGISGRPVFGGHGGVRVGVGIGAGRAFGGFGYRPGFHNFGVRSFGHNRFYGGFFGGYWPYAYSWPVYSSFGYWPLSDDYTYVGNPAYSYAPQPNVTVVYPETPPSPVVISEPVRPVMRDYRSGGYGLSAPQPAAPPPDEKPIYLIAFKDQVIRPAEAYWVDGGTLHYVTLQHEQKEVPLSSVDRALSNQLNRERRVPFHLPD